MYSAIPLSLRAGQGAAVNLLWASPTAAAPSAVIDGSLRAACPFWRRGGAQSRSKDSWCAYATPPHSETPNRNDSWNKRNEPTSAPQRRP